MNLKRNHNFLVAEGRKGAMFQLKFRFPERRDFIKHRSGLFPAWRRGAAEAACRNRKMRQDLYIWENKSEAKLQEICAFAKQL